MSTLTRQRTEGVPDALRPVRITRHYTIHAEGSVLVEFGNTKVLCTASVEERCRRTSAAQGEAGSRPNTACRRAPRTPGDREAARASSPAAQEIQRLIGRSLRCVFDLKLSLGERT